MWIMFIGVNALALGIKMHTVITVTRRVATGVLNVKFGQEMRKLEQISKGQVNANRHYSVY